MLFIFHVMSNKIKRLQKYNSVQSKVVLNLATIIHIKESYLHSSYFLKCSFNSLVRKAIGLLCNLATFAICNTCTLQHLHFATFALCNTCTLQHLHFATLVLCNTCTLQHLHFAIIGVPGTSIRSVPTLTGKGINTHTHTDLSIYV